MMPGANRGQQRQEANWMRMLLQCDASAHNGQHKELVEESPLHEALAFAVAQNASLPPAAFSDETTRAIDAGGMKLHKLQVLTHTTSEH